MTFAATRSVPDIRIDAASEVDRIVDALRNNVGRRWRRGGVVVGVSGGVDSSTVLHLCARAFGSERILALLMPEKDSSPDSERLAREVTDSLGIEALLVDLQPGLEALGCYARRDGAVRRAYPSYDPRVHRIKIVLPSGLSRGALLNLYNLVIVDPDGGEHVLRMPRDVFLEIVAASNMKQRSRMLTLYFHAEARNYAVIGTANKNERQQGFFVKFGDDGVDIQAIGHLLKTQVYQLAEFLGVPEEICSRPPTSDTYSADCTQEEFFFRLPFHLMDQLWTAQEQGCSAFETAEALGLDPAEVESSFADFDRKRRTTEYLRTPPVFLSPLSPAGPIG